MSDRTKSVVAALLVLAICGAVFFVHADLPGLYMDSINPEYLAVRALNPDAARELYAWIVPGNLIAGKYPVLAGSYYHGPLQLYVSLPVYLALGTDIGAARIAQFMYAALVLLASWRLLRLAGAARALTFAGLALLAIDPGFVHIFKTQALSIVWPLSLMLFSIAIVESRVVRAVPLRWPALLAAGLLAGLAFFSYFVFLFFAPVLYLHVVQSLRRQAHGSVRAGLLRSWAYVAGYLLGTAPYFVGFWLMYDRLGSAEKFLAALNSDVEQLEVIRAPVADAGGGLGAALDNVVSAVTDHWLNRMVLAQNGWSEYTALAGLAFLCVPILLGIVAWRKRWPARLLHLGNALIVSYVVLSLPFANRLSGHHYTLLLPLAYLAWISACHYLYSARAGDGRASHKRIGLMFGAAAILVFAGSAFGQWRFLEALGRTGGVAQYSDAINRLSESAMESGKEEYFYFPDWGFAMPFQFLTNGSIAARNGVPAPQQLQRMVCMGQSVNVVYDLPRAATPAALAAHESRLDEASAGLRGYTPKRLAYRGRDGRLEFTVVKYEADEAGEVACASFPHCTVSVSAPDIRLAADPCDIRKCPTRVALPVVRVRWDVTSRTEQLQVWVRSGDARKLWMNTGSKGEADTGPWANSGVGFEFIDAADNRVLGSITLGGVTCPP